LTRFLRVRVRVREPVRPLPRPSPRPMRWVRVCRLPVHRICRPIRVYVMPIARVSASRA